MFLLVATNNPRGLNNSGRARDKTRTLRLCLKRYQKQRASPKRVSAPTSHTGCVCYRMVAGQCFSRRLAGRQQVLRHGASQKDLHDRHAPLFLSRKRRKKALSFHPLRQVLIYWRRLPSPVLNYCNVPVGESGPDRGVLRWF